MKKLLSPFRVGVLAIISGAFLFIFISFVRKGGLSKEESITVHALFKDASGLGKRSRVQIAGIPVGEIATIELEGNRARLTLRIRKDVGLHTDATLRKRSESLLGDYMLDLFPGSESAPLMPDGGEIGKIVDQQGMEALFEKLTTISDDVQQVTSSLKNVLGGEKGTAALQQVVDNMVRITNSVDTTLNENTDKLSTILSNIEAISRDVRGMTGQNQEKVNQIVDNVRQITVDTQAVASALREMIAGSGDGDTAVNGLKQTVSRLDSTLDNLEQITSNLREGKGTVGALLNDPKMSQQVSEAVEDLSDIVSRVGRLKVEVSLKSEYLLAQGASKNALGIRLIPRPDKYYLIDIVDDPRGSVETVVVQSNPPATGQPATQVQRITRDQLKVSAQFAKRYYFLTLRFGIIENTGGLGADLHFLNDALAFKLDAFNFSTDHLALPRLRATLRVQAFNHLFITAGGDDLLNNPVRDSFTNRLIAGRDFFFGGGVYFTDDDLKAVLTAVPVPTP